MKFHHIVRRWVICSDVFFIILPFVCRTTRCMPKICQQKKKMVIEWAEAPANNTVSTIRGRTKSHTKYNPKTIRWAKNAWRFYQLVVRPQQSMSASTCASASERYTVHNHEPRALSSDGFPNNKSRASRNRRWSQTIFSVCYCVLSLRALSERHSSNTLFLFCSRPLRLSRWHIHTHTHMISLAALGDEPLARAVLSFVEFDGK